MTLEVATQAGRPTSRRRPWGRGGRLADWPGGAGPLPGGALGACSLVRPDREGACVCTRNSWTSGESEGKSGRGCAWVWEGG